MLIKSIKLVGLPIKAEEKLSKAMRKKYYYCNQEQAKKMNVKINVVYASMCNRFRKKETKLM